MESSLLVGHSAGWWDGLMLVSLIAAALAAGFVAVATTGAVLSHKREEQAAKSELDRYKAEAEEKTAASNAVAQGAKADAENAHALGVKSQADLAVANAAIADANARAEEARAGAEKARLALEEYKRPRNLDSESFLRILKRSKPAKVEVLYVRECADCAWVAQFVGDFLNTAGWSAQYAPIDEKAAASGPWRYQPTAVSVRGAPWGITLVTRENSAESLIQKFVKHSSTLRFYG